MENYTFLSVDDVIRIHDLQINKRGGAHGLRDANGLSSAVNSPVNVMHYADGDIFDAAAAYLYNIAQAQAFLDGNKRTGAHSAIVFLITNGCNADFDEAILYDLANDIAEGSKSRGDVASYLRSASE